MTKNDIHIMIDLETTSNDVFNNTLLQIAMVAFNYETGKVLDTFNTILDSSLYNSITFNTGTLKFWLDNSEVLSKLFDPDENPDAEYTTEVEMVSSAVRFIKKFKEPMNTVQMPAFDGVYLWGNGENFDNTILHHKCSEYKIPYPIDYNKDMDIRTYMKTIANLLGKQSSDFKDFSKNENLHDAISDCKFQIDYMMAARKELEDHMIK